MMQTPVDINVYAVKRIEREGWYRPRDKGCVEGKGWFVRRRGALLWFFVEPKAINNLYIDRYFTAISHYPQYTRTSDRPINDELECMFQVVRHKEIPSDASVTTALFRISGRTPAEIEEDVLASVERTGYHGAFPRNSLRALATALCRVPEQEIVRLMLSGNLPEEFRAHWRDARRKNKV